MPDVAVPGDYEARAVSKRVCRVSINPIPAPLSWYPGRYPPMFSDRAYYRYLGRRCRVCMSCKHVFQNNVTRYIYAFLTVL